MQKADSWRVGFLHFNKCRMDFVSRKYSFVKLLTTAGY